MRNEQRLLALAPVIERILNHLGLPAPGLAALTGTRPLPHAA